MTQDRHESEVMAELETQEYNMRTGNLAAALAKAQGAMEGAKKGSDNPFFKSKYADLAEVWKACRAVLSENGLSVAQVTKIADDGSMYLETMLLHSSGESIAGQYPIEPVKKDPQGMGSAITYARRYALAAMVGVAQEDDDGNAASHTPAKVIISRQVRDEFSTQVRAAIEIGDDLEIKKLFSEWSLEEKTALWKEFSSTEKAALKDFLK